MFGFFSMMFLVEPLPALIGALLFKITGAQQLFNHKAAIIIYFSLAGCIQWYLIGFSIAKYVSLKNRIGFYRGFNFLSLILLSLIFSVYTLSLASMRLWSLRVFSEKTFLLLWALVIVFLPFNIARFLLYKCRTTSAVPR